MSRFTVSIVLGLLVFASFGRAGAEDAGDGYNVTWNTPSAGAEGTMPLGNGEVALNAWIEPSGDLRFYIARTDSWDDNGRLVKVGSVRIRVGEGAAERTATFRQTLLPREGAMVARFGQGEDQVDLRLWVDAHRPVVCVEIESAAPTTASAHSELWRTERQTLASVETSDIYAGRPEPTVVEPDTVLTGLTDRIGWIHRNTKSVGPALCAEIQDVADFARPDPLMDRTFGALVSTERPERIDELTLGSSSGTRHVFEIAVHTKHPATAEEWLGETGQILADARAVPLAERRRAHEAWWAAFWNRSWIHIRQNGRPIPGSEATGFPPANTMPIRIGADQHDGSRFGGEFGRVGVYDAALAPEAIASLAAQGPDAATMPAGVPQPIYRAVPESPATLPELKDQTFSHGLTLEAWLRTDERADNGGRIVDKITPGGSDGFLFDTWPGKSLRLIVGRQTFHRRDVLTGPGWQHVAATVTPGGRLQVFLQGKPLPPADAGASESILEGDDASVVSRAYALQRYVAACAGRGRFPIKFNGSLFTVPSEGAPGDADYRRWGPGYWWQNTRLPYYSMCTSGDFEMMVPLFRMYGQDLVPLMVHRTRKYLGHGGMYIPECIYFWGDMFTETYGWQPASERKDKLQASGWHKWEWVSGLELVGLMLDYYEHTGDEAFLRETALPVAREVLAFFDEHYATGPDGKLVMHPAQALETWWDCVNPMPELAGLYSLTSRLQGLPESLTAPADREFWRQLEAKLPALPTRTVDGVEMLAPAQEFQHKSNIENPELYAVFPFRLVTFEKPNAALGLAALEHRGDRGAQGWRQEDIFMAWLGLADPARDYVVQRARSKHAASRFPVFWGPNYDWVPDQDHGSVLLKAVQSMLMQTEGRRIVLLPAWPADWDADFRLCAPLRTVVEGKVRSGQVIDLHVTPAERAADVIVRP